MGYSVNINSFYHTVATDLKLSNVLLGIMGHSSTFACFWCEATSNQLDERGDLRTLIDKIMKNFMDWKDHGINNNNAKNFKRCTNDPILNTNSDEDEWILELIPPPELHLVLGVVNTFFFSYVERI